MRRARTRKVGGSVCSLPPYRRTPGESGASSTPTSRRAGLVQGRVNLLVAPDEVATVVDVRRRRRHLLGGRISAGHLLAEGQAVARIGGHEPYPNTIPVGRRWSVCAPWLTAIFDIDPEDHAPALAPFARRARIGHIGGTVHHEGLHGPPGGYAAAQEEGGADESGRQHPCASPVDHRGRRPAVRPREAARDDGDDSEDLRTDRSPT